MSAASPNLSWLQRAGAWVRRVNRKRLARRKLRKQRVFERAWLEADDPRRPEVARALQERLAICGSDVKLSVMLWPGGESAARDRALGALARLLHSNWELLLTSGRATAERHRCAPANL